ncbi:MAG: SRPBCC family protein [Chlorobiaceae bacterium]|nr:SRPBCC family protein [Chlorobiaceae bacterium]
MSYHTRIWVQKIPVTIDEAWGFFSTPDNLAKITPPDMMFRIINGTGARPISEGMVITYTLCPVMMIPVDWATEIMKVSEPDLFEDRQLAGPYEEWHHRHEFVAVEGGVRMTDTVRYRLPMGAVGELVESLFAGRRLEEVFDYRRRRIEGIFGRMD